MKHETAAAAWEHYLRVRDAVQRMSPDWRGYPGDEPLTPLWDATPELVGKLRDTGKVITGVRRSQYTGPRAEAFKAQRERELGRLLAKGDPALLISEPDALGGFGFVHEGTRYNEETIEAFRVLSILQDAALLREFRELPPRKTVWQIGGGWGALAYQFRSACPDVTYLMTLSPATCLVAATYLQTVLPGVRVRFFDPAAPEAFWRDWDQADLAFAPAALGPDVAPPRLDLVLDCGALARLPAGVVASHAARAHALGCRSFLTVGPAVDGEDGIATSGIVDRWYWPHPVTSGVGVRKRLALGDPREGEVERVYRLGWRRLVA